MNIWQKAKTKGSGKDGIKPGNTDLYPTAHGGIHPVEGESL